MIFISMESIALQRSLFLISTYLACPPQLKNKASSFHGEKEQLQKPACIMNMQARSITFHQDLFVQEFSSIIYYDS